MPNLTRRQFLASTAATGAAPLLAKKKPPLPPPPNVVLIVAEDLAAWMCGCYGNLDIKTPNIDLLARLGTRFLNAFTIAGAGSPSRATLFTGRTPLQHGIQDYLTKTVIEDPPQGQAAPPPWFTEEVFLSDILSAAGYDCGYSGVWDLGDYTRPGHHLGFTYTVPSGSPYQNPTIARNGEIAPAQGYLPDLITGAGLEFLDHQQPGKHFFLTLGYPNPHEPYDGHPQKYYDMYAAAQFETIGWRPRAENAFRGREYLDDTVASLRRAAAAIAGLDAQLPKLQRKLREMKVWSDTLVILTSVNGNTFGRHGLWGAGHGSNPINMYDDVMRVPLIAAWPGEIPVEGTRPDMFSVYDLLPTLTEACRGELPANRNLCGHSFFRPVAKIPESKKVARRPRHVFGQHRDTIMVRDDRFKLVFRDNGEGPNEFYSFARDPRELRNEYENLNFITVRDRMAKLINSWVETYSR